MAAAPAALLDLARRCEAAEGPDRQLDADIEELVGETGERPGDHLCTWARNRREYLLTVSPRFSESLDACRALHGRLLPGWHGEFTLPSPTTPAWASVSRHDSITEYEGRGRSLPLAWLAAMLRALVAQAGKASADD